MEDKKPRGTTNLSFSWISMETHLNKFLLIVRVYRWFSNEELMKPIDAQWGEVNRYWWAFRWLSPISLLIKYYSRDPTEFFLLLLLLLLYSFCLHLGSIQFSSADDSQHTPNTQTNVSNFHFYLHFNDEMYNLLDWTWSILLISTEKLSIILQTERG